MRVAEKISSSRARLADLKGSGLTRGTSSVKQRLNLQEQCSTILNLSHWIFDKGRNKNVRNNLLGISYTKNMRLDPISIQSKTDLSKIDFNDILHIHKLMLKVPLGIGGLQQTGFFHLKETCYI